MKRKKAVLSDSEDDDTPTPGETRASAAHQTTVSIHVPIDGLSIDMLTGAEVDSIRKAVLNEAPLTPPVKRSRAVSDEENSDSEGPDRKMAAKLRELGSDSEDEDGPAKTKDEKTLFGSDSESGEDQEE